jgi:cytochrome c-type biogenesis protein CcmE
MSRKLDEELANAIRETEPSGGEAPASAPGLAKPVEPIANKRGAGRNIGLLATLLVMVGAVVALFMVGFKEAAIYALPVDQVTAAKEKFTNRKLRVEGHLVPGTLSKRDQPCEYRFTIHGAEKTNEIPVRYEQCVIPDTFRDVPGGGVEVTVEGKLSAQGHFDATLVMAKCTSKYDPTKHEIQGQEVGSLSANP